MRVLAVVLATTFLAASAGAQSLAELAEREKERRRKLREEKAAASKTYDDYNLTRVRHGRSADSFSEPKDPDLTTANQLKVAQQREEDSTPKPAESLVLASLVDEAMPEATKDVEFQRSRGGQLPLTPGSRGVATTDSNFFSSFRETRSDRFFDGAIYTDWFRSQYEDGLSTAQLSTRVKLEAGKRPGYGWRMFFDGRHRYRDGSASKNTLLLYDARLIYDRTESPLALSLGQMNLYESAGVGQLAGAVVGVRPGEDRNWTIGGYGGLEPDIYAVAYDLKYTKYGVFSQYHGSGAKSFALSYNTILYEGVAEREFLYGSGLIPVSDAAVVYGSAEYELGDGVLSEDRLSHLFLNTRYSFTPKADVTAYYSSGRGLDYHRFLLEQSQTPDRNSPELERFYYSTSFGARFSYKVHDRARVFVAQRESEQVDDAIKNHTTQIGASAWDIANSGIGVYGSYNINRGDQSESDSYRLSISRDFGPLSWTGYFSSTFNGIRFDERTGRPEIVRLADHRTISNDFFFNVTDSLALSLEHDLSRRGEEDENTLFFRFMLRF